MDKTTFRSALLMSLILSKNGMASNTILETVTATMGLKFDAEENAVQHNPAPFSYEFTIQFMSKGCEWNRVTAVYDKWTDVIFHAHELLADGYIIRILGRDSNNDMKTWYTCRLVDRKIVLRHSILSCPV